MTTITVLAAVVCAFVALTAADNDPAILPNLWLVPRPTCIGVRCPRWQKCVLRHIGGRLRPICIPWPPGRKRGYCPLWWPWWPWGWRRSGSKNRRICRRPWRRCFRDRDCPRNLKCCRDRCGRRTCQRPVFPFSKRGRCPRIIFPFNILKAGRSRRHRRCQCRWDSDCPGRLKCCRRSRFGCYTCQVPV